MKAGPCCRFPEWQQYPTRFRRLAIFKVEGEGLHVNLETYSPPCLARCLNRSLNSRQGLGQCWRWVTSSRYFSGTRFVTEAAEGFSEHDDKRRHRTFHRVFRTLSLASPPVFVDSALVPGALDAVKSVLKEPKGLPPPLGWFWATAGKLSVERDDLLKSKPCIQLYHLGNGGTARHR